MLAAIGDLYVGMGMGLVMGMGWDEGGSLSHVETFLGCLSPVGLSSQLSVRGRGMSHVAPCTWGGAGFPFQTYIQKNAAASNIETFTFEFVRGRNWPFSIAY